MTGPPAYGAYYQPSVFPGRTINHFTTPIGLTNVASSQVYRSLLDNEGKVVSGQDRQGDQYTITVHGPGTVVVTDATPNDGVLDDDINTIQIVGADPNRTYVTGQTTASASVITDGQIYFNHLISENGVKSIILNGFNLSTTVSPTSGQPNNVGPEIYLPGGVGTLQFNNISATLDVAQNDQPYEIVIGAPTTRMAQRPNIRVNHVFNTVTNSALGSVSGSVPVTTPTVSFLVNGDINNIELGSATAAPIDSPGYAFNYPATGATGRTAIRATGINNLRVQGAARNFTASRAGSAFQPQSGANILPVASPSTVPFRSPFSGLNYLRSAKFGGPTDGVGLDVNGPLGGAVFARGIGDPTGILPGEGNLGYNEAQRGYASYGYYGGLIVAKRLGNLQVGPNNVILQTSQDPSFIQLTRQGSTHYFARPGNALTNAAVTTDGSINNVTIIGSAQSSEIKTGFNYASYIAGLEGTRAPSQIRRLHMNGDLVDSVISATYRPNNHFYGDAGNFSPTNPSAPTGDVAGPGLIYGRFRGTRAFAGNPTVLGNYGVGFYARTKIGVLPPPNQPTRIHGVRVRP